MPAIAPLPLTEEIDFHIGFTLKELKNVIQAYRLCVRNYLKGRWQKAKSHMTIVADYYTRLQTAMPVDATALYLSLVAHDVKPTPPLSQA